MKTIMRNRPLMRLAVCLISMAAMILQRLFGKRYRP